MAEKTPEQKLQEKKVQEYLQKHKPKSPEELRKELESMEAAKDKYTQNVEELETNIKDFHKSLTPVIGPGGKPLCWIRTPTNAEIEKFSKPEATAFMVMAELIEKPKHDAKYWEDHTNIDFQMLFQSTYLDMFRRLGVAIENF